jgi:hypothetical protein
MNWINEFRGLNSDDKKIIIREIIKQQTTSVIKGMHSKDDNIELLGLGRFIIKPMRKTYYDIRRDNPNLSNNEVVDLVKKKYLERKNNAKILLNKDNLKTT